MYTISVIIVGDYMQWKRKFNSYILNKRSKLKYTCAAAKYKNEKLR